MLELIRGIILDRGTDIPEDAITEETDFFLDLEWSDRDLYACAAALEDATGKTIDLEDLGSLHTIGELIGLVA